MFDPNQFSQLRCSQSSKLSQENDDLPISQITNLSQVSTYAFQLAEYATDAKKSSQENFGVDCANLDPKLSQQSKSSNNSSQTSERLKTFVGVDKVSPYLKENSPFHSLPDSQKTNYFSLPSENFPTSTLTLDAFQEDDHLLEEDDEQMENDDLENANQTSNFKQQKRTAVSEIKYPHVKQMHIMIENERMNGRNHQSIGKSNEIISKLKEQNHMYGDGFNNNDFNFKNKQITSDDMQIEQSNDHFSKDAFNYQSNIINNQTGKGMLYFKR